MASEDEQQPRPPVINYVLGFLLVGLAWGLTTPFIRRAAKDHRPPHRPILDSDAVQRSWLKRRLYGAFFAVIDLLRNPRYAVPLLINLTGSVWFFLLIGQAGRFPPPNFPAITYSHAISSSCGVFVMGLVYEILTEFIAPFVELSLTVPIVNTLAFIFTVLGDWWIDKKVISRGELLYVDQSLIRNPRNPFLLTVYRNGHWHGSLAVWNSALRAEQDWLIDL